MVRVISADGNQLGVMAISEALKLAVQQGADLVEVSPNARPPVCKIMDFGKFKYEQSKHERQAKKKQHVYTIKEVKVRPKIEEHDFIFKIRNARKFLLQRDKVKFTCMFRGREMTHMELGHALLEKIVEEICRRGIRRVEAPVGGPLADHDRRPEEGHQAACGRSGSRGGGGRGGRGGRSRRQRS